MANQLNKNSLGIQYRPSTTARPELTEYILNFDDLNSRDVFEAKIETGINTNAPAIMIVDSMKLYIDCDTELNDAEMMAYLSSDANSIIHVEAGTGLYSFSQEKALSLVSKSSSKVGEFPILADVNKHRPIYEEELYLGFGHTLYKDDNIRQMSGTVVLTLAKYKTTQKQWMDIATANTTGNRFI